MIQIEHATRTGHPTLITCTDCRQQLELDDGDPERLLAVAFWQFVRMHLRDGYRYERLFH